jgi:hypothetical protein
VVDGALLAVGADEVRHQLKVATGAAPVLGR